METIDEFVSLLQERVKNNVRIIEPHETPSRCVFHISTKKPVNGISTYNPQLSRRAASSEDNTVARITTAPTLEGCLIGYNTLYQKALYSQNPKQEHPYNGGFYIYRLQFEKALKPTKELVFDAELSNELWLVTYNTDTIEYSGECVGQLIPINVNVQLQGKTNETAMQIAVKVDTEVIALSNNLYITKGYWEIVFKNNNEVICQIRRDQNWYDNNKRLRADLLSYQDSTTLLEKQW